MGERPTTGEIIRTMTETKQILIRISKIMTITIPMTMTITVPITMTMTMTTHSDSSMFDGREADDRWDNPKQAAVYWGEGLGRHAAEGSDAIFLSEFLIQPLSVDTFGARRDDTSI